MSNFALLIGAKPRQDKVGPPVRLEAGRYVARLENVQDSVIMLCNTGGAIGRLMEGILFELTSDDYWTHISSIGKEQRINVLMTKVQ